MYYSDDDHQHPRDKKESSDHGTSDCLLLLRPLNEKFAFLLVYPHPFYAELFLGLLESGPYYYSSSQLIVPIPGIPEFSQGSFF